MSDDRKNKKQPRALSPTPLRDWVLRQASWRRAGLVSLFALLIACGGKAGFSIDLTPVPATQQLLFALLAGALLGSRLGAVSSMAYLLLASFLGVLWPIGSGGAPLVGPLAGYLWALPLASYLCGFFVERNRSEAPVYFAIGASAAVGAFDAAGSLRLLAAQNLDAPEAFLKGAGIFVGQHFAQGALTVLIASSASNALQAKERK